MSPKHRVCRHLTGEDGANDEGALRPTCLMAVRRATIDVSVDKTTPSYGTERHQWQPDCSRLAWQVQFPSR